MQAMSCLLALRRRNRRFDILAGKTDTWLAIINLERFPIRPRSASLIVGLPGKLVDQLYFYSKKWSDNG